MTPLQRKPFEGWEKEDLVWINPAGKENDFAHMFSLNNIIKTNILIKSALQINL